MVNERRILFIHPDLGIGGAERLVVDAALALKSKAYEVQFVTCHHDPSHCFSETVDGTFPVTVVGDWLPTNIFGKFLAFCAYFRMVYAAIYIAFFSGLKPDVIFCDQVSICIPFLHFCSKNVVFYCHFPDQLLSKPGSKMKSVYRYILNWLEEHTTGMADVVLVNSKFTASVFRQTFTKLNITPSILYPSINTNFFDKSNIVPLQSVLPNLDLKDDSILFLSINRYERKKEIDLAISAFQALKCKLEPEIWTKIYLIVAGGYDSRVIENVEHYEELKELATTLSLSDKVIFLKSPSDAAKLSLLKHAFCLLYTPSNEHFGIVPLEAMYMRTPVIAVNSGGPTETVAHNKTGFLCEPMAESFSEMMLKLITTTTLAKELGCAGRQRVIEKFSFDSFSLQLDEIIKTLLRSRK